MLRRHHRTSYDALTRLDEVWSATATWTPDILGYDEASMHRYDPAGGLRYRGYRLIPHDGSSSTFVY